MVHPSGVAVPGVPGVRGARQCVLGARERGEGGGGGGGQVGRHCKQTGLRRCTSASARHRWVTSAAAVPVLGPPLTFQVPHALSHWRTACSRIIECHASGKNQEEKQKIFVDVPNRLFFFFWLVVVVCHRWTWGGTPWARAGKGRRALCWQSAFSAFPRIPKPRLPWPLHSPAVRILAAAVKGEGGTEGQLRRPSWRLQPRRVGRACHITEHRSSLCEPCCWAHFCGSDLPACALGAQGSCLACKRACARTVLRGRRPLRAPIGGWGGGGGCVPGPVVPAPGLTRTLCYAAPSPTSRCSAARTGVGLQGPPWRQGRTLRLWRERGRRVGPWSPNACLLLTPAAPGEERSCPRCASWSALPGCHA